MRVLGVDPGLTRCGLGVVDGDANRRVSMVAVDVIMTPAGADLAHRLLALEQAIEGWILQVRPDVVAVERVFSQHNVRTVMGTAQASGIAMLVAARHDLPVALHTPSEVKAAVTGSGRAGKDQVAAMITRILGLPERPRPADAADALALAVCHLWRGNLASAAVRMDGAELTPAQRAWIEASAAAKATTSRAAAAATPPTRRRSTEFTARRAPADPLPG